MIISDNGKEFANIGFKKFCAKKNIMHKIVRLESHRSNGRVERLIETIRDGLCKFREGSFDSRIKYITDTYNNTYHTAIKCTPAEAWRDYTGIAMLENSENGRYCKRFAKKKRDSFEIGQKVLIAQHENIKTDIKSRKGRFKEIGTVLEKFEGDSYLVKYNDGKIKKKRHFDLKRLWCETPSREGDVVYNINK